MDDNDTDMEKVIGADTDSIIDTFNRLRQEEFSHRQSAGPLIVVGSCKPRTRQRSAPITGQLRYTHASASMATTSRLQSATAHPPPLNTPCSSISSDDEDEEIVDVDVTEPAMSQHNARYYTRVTNHLLQYYMKKDQTAGFYKAASEFPIRTTAPAWSGSKSTPRENAITSQAYKRGLQGGLARTPLLPQKQALFMETPELKRNQSYIVTVSRLQPVAQGKQAGGKCRGQCGGQSGQLFTCCLAFCVLSRISELGCSSFSNRNIFRKVSHKICKFC